MEDSDQVSILRIPTSPVKKNVTLSKIKIGRTMFGYQSNKFLVHHSKNFTRQINENGGFWSAINQTNSTLTGQNIKNVKTEKRTVDLDHV